MDPTAALAHLNSPLPLCYRLIRRGDGNGNMLPVLQGAFLITVRGKTTHEWCDLETQDEPYVEDHIPFFAPDEQSDALQAVCDELADEERADV